GKVVEFLDLGAGFGHFHLREGHASDEKYSEQKSQCALHEELLELDFPRDLAAADVRRTGNRCQMSFEPRVTYPSPSPQFAWRVRRAKRSPARRSPDASGRRHRPSLRSRRRSECSGL